MIEYNRINIYEIKDVLPYSHKPPKNHKDKVRKEYMGQSVNMSSHRYWCFKKKGIKCVKCGIKGKFFALETPTFDKIERFHFNLYAIDKNGEDILMTKDHIIPVSRGGKSHISNYQTMCEPCNNKKGSNYEKRQNKIFLWFNNITSWCTAFIVKAGN